MWLLLNIQQQTYFNLKIGVNCSLKLLWAILNNLEKLTDATFQSLQRHQITISRKFLSSRVLSKEQFVSIFDERERSDGTSLHEKGRLEPLNSALGTMIQLPEETIDGGRLTRLPLSSPHHFQQVYVWIRLQAKELKNKFQQVVEQRYLH